MYLIRPLFFLLGDLVEYGDTDQLFSTPKEKRQKIILPVDLVNARENIKNEKSI